MHEPNLQRAKNQPEIQSESQPVSFRTFQQIARTKEKSVGGKAYNLALLQQEGLAVPNSLVLSSMPSQEHFESELMSWWRDQKFQPLAARSSACGEDAKDASFAGQLTSVLNIKTREEFVSALATCFSSSERMASQAYQEHFQQKLLGMNVLVQCMVPARFSGVFFSRDPRQSQQVWLIEVTEGLGEKLVSGHVTPFRFSQSERPLQSPTAWTPEHLQQVFEAGQRITTFFGYPVDIEWAIDPNNKLWILQARPITTSIVQTADEITETLSQELKRLEFVNGENTLWDSQTFVEWTNVPTPLSFSVWEKAFSPSGSFIKALRLIGYQGALEKKSPSLLELIFGRPCLNIQRLEPVFFGQIPYDMVSTPQPHLEFNRHKIDLSTILHAPDAILRMITVAWKLQHPQDLLTKCDNALKALSKTANHKSITANFSSLTNQITTEFRPEQISTIDLLEKFEQASSEFAEETLTWPLALAITAESTLQTLTLTLEKDLGREKAQTLLQKWMKTDLHTVTRKMDRDYKEACREPEKRAAFLGNYGHRGSGELDLAHPRWSEKGDKTFISFNSSRPEQIQALAVTTVEDDIRAQIHLFRHAFVLAEWTTLKSILELREQWKMEVMRHYAHLRELALALSQRLDLKNEIFYLHLNEIYDCIDERNTANDKPLLPPTLREKILDRQRQAKIFQKIAIPKAFSVRSLKEFLDHRLTPNSEALPDGEPLSPGLGYGEVRIVDDPSEVDLESWPAQVILVARATDPGWTPLFQRASGIVVERGGVLSHCAIVAREMGIPAVSNIIHCTERLKNGDHIWIDGNHGRITTAPNH